MAQDESRFYMERFIASEHFRKTVLIVLSIITVVLFCLSAHFFSSGIGPSLKDSILGHEFLKHIFPHVFAVSLELLLAVVLIELVWRNHEKLREKEVRLTQLRLIKLQMFQSDMLELFSDNFGALDKSVMVKNHKLSLDYLCKVTKPEDLREIERWLTTPDNVETTAKENKKTKDKTKEVNRNLLQYRDGGLAKV